MSRYPLRLMTATLAGLLLAGIGAFAIAAEAGKWEAPARAARKKNPVPADDKSVAAGKVFYTKECASCHGATGKGDGPASKDLAVKPGDLSSPSVTSQTDGALFWKVTTGRTPMPGFEKLYSDDDRWNVVNYMRTLAPKPADGKGEAK